MQLKEKEVKEKNRIVKLTKKNPKMIEVEMSNSLTLGLKQFDSFMTEVPII